MRASIDVERGYGSVYRSFRRIMYAVERYVRCSMRMLSDAVEMDEVYVNAGLKGGVGGIRMLSRYSQS